MTLYNPLYYTITSSGSEDSNILATYTLTVTPGSIRSGGSSFWITTIGYGSGPNDVGDEESNYTEIQDFGVASGDTDSICFLAKSYLGTSSGEMGVAVGFTSDEYLGKYAGISYNNGPIYWAVNNDEVSHQEITDSITTINKQVQGNALAVGNWVGADSNGDPYPIYSEFPTDETFTATIYIANSIPTE